MTYIITIENHTEIFRGSRKDAARWAKCLMANGTRGVAMRREILPTQFPIYQSGRPRFISEQK